MTRIPAEPRYTPDRWKLFGSHGQRPRVYGNAKQDDECLLHIECKPRSSVPFWKRMGFRLYDEAFGETCPQEVRFHAFQILEKRYELAVAAGDEVEVTIEFHDECDGIRQKIQLSGMREERKRIALPRRLVSYRPSTVFKCADLYVSIHVNGNELYSGKAKYPEAAAVGVRRRNNETYVIDALTLPDENLRLSTSTNGSRSP